MDYEAMGKSANCREGIESFFDKRPAKFTLKPSRDMPDVYPWWREPGFE